jgi:hypothetical protein
LDDSLIRAADPEGEAECLRVPPCTVYRHTREGRLVASKIRWQHRLRKGCEDHTPHHRLLRRLGGGGKFLLILVRWQPLTSVASVEEAELPNRILASSDFIDHLWPLHRASPLFHFARDRRPVGSFPETERKEASQGRLSR